MWVTADFKSLVAFLRKPAGILTVSLIKEH